MHRLTLAHLRRYAIARSLFAPTSVARCGANAGIRAGGSDSRARARAGSDTAPPCCRLSRRRSRTAVPDAGHRGGRVRQLRIPAARALRADAPAHPANAVGTHDAPARGGRARIRPRARRSASARRRRALRARCGSQLLGRLVECDDAPARRPALPRPAARRAARQRHTGLRGTRAASGTARCRNAARAARCTRGHRDSQVRAAAACKPRCRSCGGFGTARRNGAAGLAARSCARGSGLRMRTWTASTGTGRPAKIRAGSARRGRIACACSRRSIPLSGTARVSSSSGTGHTASKPTRRRRLRKLGYYALPLLWRDKVVGWANLSVAGGVLQTSLGYVAGRPPRDARFARQLERELVDMRAFLRL